MSCKLPIVWVFFLSLSLSSYSFLVYLFALQHAVQLLFAVATRQSPSQHSPRPKPNIYYKYLPRDDPNKSHSRVCRHGCVYSCVCVLSQVHFSFYWCGMLATHLPHSAATSRANKCACVLLKHFAPQNQPQMHHVARDFNLFSTFAFCQRNWGGRVEKPHHL